jgi:MFS family permease
MALAGVQPARTLAGNKMIGIETARATSRPLRVLRNRNFCLFFTVQTVSVMGTWMQVTALGWLLYRLTASAYLVAVLVFLNQIPVLFLSAWAGVLADRFDRRKLLIFTQSASFVLTLLLAGLVLLRNPDVKWLLLLVGLGGVVYALDLPARQSFLCDLVGSAQIRNAVILNSLSFHLARMTGPLLAGILIAGAGEGWCVLLNSVSFFCVVVALIVIGKRGPPSVIPTRSNTGIVEALRYVRSHPELLRILLLLSVVSLLGAQHSTFIPVLTKQNMHGGARSLGLLMAAPGSGALTAALLLLFRSVSRHMSSLLPGMTLMSGVTITVLAWSTQLWLAEALLILLGFCITFQNAGSNILLQENAPEWIRGRIMALFSTAFMGLMAAGAFLLGLAARHGGVSPVLFIAGMVCAMAALAVEAAVRTRRVAVVMNTADGN